MTASKYQIQIKIAGCWIDAGQTESLSNAEFWVKEFTKFNYESRYIDLEATI